MWDKHSLFTVVISYLVYLAHTQVTYTFSECCQQAYVLLFNYATIAHNNVGFDNNCII